VTDARLHRRAMETSVDDPAPRLGRSGLHESRSRPVSARYHL